MAKILLKKFCTKFNESECNETQQNWMKSKYCSLFYHEVLLYFMQFYQILLNFFKFQIFSLHLKVEKIYTNYCWNGLEISPNIGWISWTFFMQWKMDDSWKNCGQNLTESSQYLSKVFLVLHFLVLTKFHLILFRKWTHSFALQEYRSYLIWIPKLS